MGNVDVLNQFGPIMTNAVYETHGVIVKVGHTKYAAKKTCLRNNFQLYLSIFDVP